jgi:2,4-diaminopentanoate dehydrogenase
VSSSVVGLVHPRTLHAAWARDLEEACRAGQSTFFTSGIDPGFANDVLPLALSGLSEHWSQIRIQEIVNYATYDQPQVLFDVLGFGQPADAAPLICAKGGLTFAWGGTLRLLAEGLGVRLDEIREVHERRMADAPIDVLGRRIERGTQSALRFEVQGIVGGEPALIVEHVTRLRDEDCPDWPQGSGSYRVTIEGVPRMVCDLAMADEHGDHARGGVVLTATRLVNAIPAVCQSAPGLLSALDLPLVAGRGLYRRGG